MPVKKRKTLFDSLTPEDKNLLAEVHGQSTRPRELRIAEMAQKFGVGGRTIGRWWTELGLTVTVGRPDTLKEAFARKLGDKQYLLITAAQNATPIHAACFRSMKAYAEFLDADIHVIPFRYKNPTSTFAGLKEDWWAPTLRPYLDLARHKVSRNLEILSDIKTQPTAAYPLRGLEGVTGGASCIIGHPKMHLQSLPVLEGTHKKILYSTGAITYENYTDSLAGKKGEFHHTLGFIIVEIDGDDFHVRQVPMCDDGSFIDLVFSVSGDSVEVIDECTAITLGDIHVGDHDEDKLRASSDLYNTLIPKYILLHDVFNGHSVNHHENKSAVSVYRRIQANRHLLKDEIWQMLSWLQGLTEDAPKSKLVVVRSNHDIWIDRYVDSQDWRKDVINADTYALCLSKLLSDEAPLGLIPYFIKEKFGDSIICLDRDDSFKPGEYEYAYHMDMGVNGSRGTITQYSRLSTKCIGGDGHHPDRINGALMAGTSTKLRCGYNQGGSSWGHADVIEHVNGKAQHIIFNEKYQFTTLFGKFNSLIYE